MRLAAGILAAVATGCVHTYQPLSGLHDPRVVNPSDLNFPELRLDVYCVPGSNLKQAEADVLCERVGAAFESQGARVDTFAVDPRNQQGDGAFGGADTQRPQADLVLELRPGPGGKVEHPLTWGLCYVTATLVPCVREVTFSQTVTVRDATGFLLARRSFRGRMIDQYGIAVWAGNKVLDRTTRDADEALSGEAASRDLSADLYGQLSQTVFDAQMRRSIGTSLGGLP